MSEYLPTRISGPPVPHEITLGYLATWPPYYTEDRRHLGVDFGSPHGTRFRSRYLNPTRVHAVHLVGLNNQPLDDWGDGSLGNCLVLDVGYLPGSKTRYYAGLAHCSRIDVKVGDIIPEGTWLGLTGDSGFAKGAHLHLQHSVNPNFSRDAETENPLSGLGLTSPPVVAPPAVEYASPHDIQRLNAAVMLREGIRRIASDPDIERVEQAAKALRAVGFQL